MTYGVEFPRVDPQLQGDLGGAIPPSKGADCGIKVIQGGVRWASRGLSIPTVAKIRHVLGDPLNPETGKPRGITTAEALTAFQAFGTKVTRLKVFDDVLDALNAGHFVYCRIDYAWVNQNAKYLSGQKTFLNAHAIGAYGLEHHPPLKHVHVAWLDPLHDERYTGVPQQIMMARPGRDLRGAMTNLGSAGFGSIVVERAPETPPDDGNIAARLEAKDAAFAAIITEAQKGQAA